MKKLVLVVLVVFLVVGFAFAKSSGDKEEGEIAVRTGSAVRTYKRSFSAGSWGLNCPSTASPYPIKQLSNRL